MDLLFDLDGTLTNSAPVSFVVSHMLSNAWDALVSMSRFILR